MGASSLEVADIFRAEGEAFRLRYGASMPRRQRRAMRAIEICRTCALGGHVYQCDQCAKLKVSYNSCRNRHCPKCQGLDKAAWVAAREKDLLPVGYFHVVFTLPSELRPLALRNPKVMYDLLFRASAETLQTIAADPQHLGARLGVIAVLHTWGQNLLDHPHLHCIVPGGGMRSETGQWISCRKNFFLPVPVLSKMFRGKFLSLLQEAYEKKPKEGGLIFPGTIAVLAESGRFRQLRAALYRKPWCVYSKAPFGGAEQVLKYLGRYTHRIAISNRRLVQFDDHRVTFRWKDYAHGNQVKAMTLEADEFIRRFLLHVLPDGFVRIRYYGLLAHRGRKKNIQKCRASMGVATEEIAEREEEETETWEKRCLRLTGFDPRVCPHCGQGSLFHLREFTPSLEPTVCLSPRAPP